MYMYKPFKLQLIVLKCSRIKKKKKKKKKSCISNKKNNKIESKVYIPLNI
jgi:hypothetical protein